MRLLAALLLNVLFSSLIAPHADAQIRDSLWRFEARIMFETIIDATGPNPATVSVIIPDGAPAPRQIAFSRSQRPNPHTMIDLTLSDNGTYTGSGQVPAPDEIRSITVTKEVGRFQLEVPAGWEEGVAAARYRVQPRNGETSTGSLSLSGAATCCPTILGFNIGMPPSVR